MIWSTSMYIHNSIYKSSSQIKKSFISKHSLGRKIYSDGPTLFHGCFTQITDTFGANQPVTSLAFIVLVRCHIYSLTDVGMEKPQNKYILKASLKRRYRNTNDIKIRCRGVLFSSIGHTFTWKCIHKCMYTTSLKAH